VTGPVRDRRHRARGRYDQQDGEHPDRAGVTGERGGRGGDRGVVDQQREQAEQDHIRLQRDVGHERQEPDDQPRHDQHNRWRDIHPAPGGDGEQGHRRHADDDEQLARVHCQILVAKRAASKPAADRSG
jgi:hypothetical protein